MNARCRADRSPWRARRAQPWLGTLVDIAARADTKRSLDDGFHAAFAAIARIHRALSCHDPESELTRINRSAARTKQPIFADMRAVLACALDVAARSRGLFDPTVGGELVRVGMLPRLADHDT